MARQNNPGNVAVGVLPANLLHSVDSVSRDDAVGASAGLEDLFRVGLVIPFVVAGVEAATEANIEAPFDMELVHLQLGVQTTGSGGNSTLDVEIDGTSIAGAPVTVANTDSDGTVATATLASVVVAKGAKITLVFALATAAAGLAGTLFAQRTGRAGGVGIPV